MPAIRPHSTEVVDRPWDGPANEARLKTDQDEDYYRRAYAWQDPDGNPRTKAAYRFIHHHVDEDGNIGPANVRACITGIAVLNGARGGTTIPDADRRGVWRHLARHLEDAGIEPPELQERSWDELQHRAFPVTRMEVRQEGDRPRLVGYAAVFNQLSEDLGGWRELIRPGAFAKTIRDGADVRALWNHNPDYVLGRTKSGTLRLREDDHGLAIEIDPPDTTWARDLIATIRRGDVDQMSFGFIPVRSEVKIIDDHDDNGQLRRSVIRELIEVRLFDVSPVTFPAYPQTEISVRSAIAELNAAIERLKRLAPAAPGLAAHPEAPSRLERARRRLMLID